MSDYFLLSIPDDNVGFGLFSPGHFAWLAIGLFFTILSVRLYRKSGRKRAIRLILASAALFLELLRSGLLILAGEYSLYTLPLHLCGIAVYLNFYHALSGNQKLGQFLYAFCFPGAVFALLFPDWEYFPLFNVLTSIAFELHILIVSCIIVQADEIRPTLRSAPSNLLIMLLMATRVCFFDRLTGTNYMFLNWPVPPLTLFRFLGNPGYLLGYLPLLALTWALIYFPYYRKGRNNT